MFQKTKFLLTDKLRRPLVVWWVALVAAFFVLTPKLQQIASLVDAGKQQTLEICTTQSTKAITADVLQAVASPAKDSSLAGQHHCPFCLHQADRYALAYAPLPAHTALLDAKPPLPQWQVVIYSNTTPLWAPPRGPPVIS